jgi:hypothetical protein
MLSGHDTKSIDAFNAHPQLSFVYRFPPSLSTTYCQIDTLNGNVHSRPLSTAQREF